MQSLLLLLTLQCTWGSITSGNAPNPNNDKGANSVNPYFRNLIEEAIKYDDSDSSNILSYVLQNLREVNWERLIRQVDLILDDKDKRVIEREIRYNHPPFTVVYL